MAKSGKITSSKRSTKSGVTPRRSGGKTVMVKSGGKQTVETAGAKRAKLTRRTESTDAILAEGAKRFHGSLSRLAKK